MADSTTSGPQDDPSDNRITGLQETKPTENIPSPTPREVFGDGMNRFSALINDNLIAARYGVMATVALLTAYGISNTPLFFRYRTVAEIPKSYFVGRKRLYCRIIGIHRDGKTGSTDAPVQIMVRHLSPIGMLLPTSWFESLMRMNPSSGNLSKPEERKSELLKLQIAGILTPPITQAEFEPEHFLERLAKKRTLVSCQLLGRGVQTFSESITNSPDGRRQRVHDLSDLSAGNEIDVVSTDIHSDQVALCKLTHRPKLFQLFPTDIAETLVKDGKANVATNLINQSTLSAHSNHGTKETSMLDSLQTEITDASQRIHDIRNDVRYLDRLATLEFEAAKKSMGMWSNPEVRQRKKDIVEEVDFQAKASFLEKLWRNIRGG